VSCLTRVQDKEEAILLFKQSRRDTPLLGLNHSKSLFYVLLIATMWVNVCKSENPCSLLCIIILPLESCFLACAPSPRDRYIDKAKGREAKARAKEERQGYRVVPGHRNWQIETAGWNWASYFTEGLETRYQRFGSFLMIYRNFFNKKSLNKTLNLVKNQHKISYKNMKSQQKSWNLLKNQHKIS